MSSFATLQLDTHAPVVTWGAPVNTDAGEELVVPYVLDEPDLLSATITLIDGRVLDMEVLAGELRVELPEDTPEGQAVVRALVRDDVWNEATRSLNVVLTGTTYTPPPTGPLPLPSPPQIDPARKVEIRPPRSVARLRDSHSTRAVAVTRSRVRARDWFVTPTQPSFPFLFERVRGDSRSAVRTRVTDTSALRGGERIRVYKRPEGPDTEDELMELGIL